VSQQQSPPTYYPVFLDLRGKRVVIVGGGQIARHKVDALLDAGAAVTVIAPQVVEMPSDVQVIRRAFQPDDLDGAQFVIAATDNPAVNAEVTREAEARHLFVNAVDDPAYCTAILPSVVKRGALRIAISTAGASPGLARQLREELEARYGPEYGEVVDLLWHLRQEWGAKMIALGIPATSRHAVWKQVLRLPLLDFLRSGERRQAELLAESCIAQAVGKLTAPNVEE